MLRVVALFIGLLLMVSPALADDLHLGAALKAGDVLRGHFVQERSLQGFQAPLKSEGSFVVAAGKGLIWKVEKPFATTTIITPSGLVQTAQGTETMRLPAAQIPFIARLYDMLSGTMTGDLSGLKAQFQVETSGSAEKWSLHLTPKEAVSGNAAGDAQNMPIQRMDLTGDHYVESVDIHRQSGDRDLLTFSDQQIDRQALSPEEQGLLTGATSQ
jgi:hypothetical protein